MLVLTYHSISDAARADQHSARCLRHADAGSRRPRPPKPAPERVHRLARGQGSARTMASSLLSTMRSKTSRRSPLRSCSGMAFPLWCSFRRGGWASPEGWQGANDPPRPLMDWATVRALANDGIEFGGHSRTHADLTKLSAADREEEIAGCAEDLSEQIGKPVEGFAAPYGRVSPEVVETIGRHYRAAFGTRLAVPERGQDRFDMPRIDMHYFRDRGHWAGLLEGQQGLSPRSAGAAGRAIEGGAHALLSDVSGAGEMQRVAPQRTIDQRCDQEVESPVASGGFDQDRHRDERRAERERGRKQNGLGREHQRRRLHLAIPGKRVGADPDADIPAERSGRGAESRHKPGRAPPRARPPSAGRRSATGKLRSPRVRG